MEITNEICDGICTLWLDFGAYNLLTYSRIEKIIQAHRLADEDSSVRVIVTRSKRKEAFSLGFDPQYIIDTPPDERQQIFQGISELINSLLQLRKPHINVIEGPAIAGGAVLAILSDYRLFQVEAGKLSFSEAKVGLALPEALIQVISNYSSPGFLKEVIVGKNIDAELAQRHGLANWVAAKDSLDKKLSEECSKLSRLSPLVLQSMKKVTNQNAVEKSYQLLDNIDEFTPFMADDLLGEGLKAYQEKRSPIYPR